MIVKIVLSIMLSPVCIIAAALLVYVIKDAIKNWKKVDYDIAFYLCDIVLVFLLAFSAIVVAWYYE